MFRLQNYTKINVCKRRAFISRKFHINYINSTEYSECYTAAGIF